MWDNRFSFDCETGLTRFIGEFFSVIPENLYAADSNLSRLDLFKASIVDLLFLLDLSSSSLAFLITFYSRTNSFDTFFDGDSIGSLHTNFGKSEAIRGFCLTCIQIRFTLSKVCLSWMDHQGLLLKSC